MRKASIDIETNLAHTIIWMAYVYYHDTEELIECRNAREFVNAMNGVDVVSGWNIIGFDLLMLERIWGFTLSKDVQVIDGMLLSRLYNPSRAGGHALATYGQQFNFPKGDFKDFDGPAEDETEEEWLTRMGVYCGQDTKLDAKACNFLCQVLNKEHFEQECIDLEHQVQEILTRQREHGFLLDVPYATELYRVVCKRMERIEKRLHKQFPPIVTKRWSEKTGKRLKDDVEVFNIGSRQQIAKRLQTLGAKFPRKTDKGNPIVDEATLDNIDLLEAKLISRYLTLQKRASQINSWLEVVDEKGRVHGRVIGNGAVTGRMTHSKPNLAQVTGVNAYMGARMRRCWVVPEGYKLVGIDASGLELRMLAHYMKDDEYTKEILDGDVHSANQRAAGLSTRNQAKTFIYAFLYGAGDAKIGSIVGGGAAQGKKLKRAFLDATPSLKNLRELVGKIAERHKSLPGLDGRRLRVRHQHAALNTLLQGAGAIVMKKALVIFDELLRDAGIEAHFVANVHDEWQMEAPAHLADAVGKLGCKAIRLAGEAFEMRCPLDGEYHIGDSWAETH